MEFKYNDKITIPNLGREAVMESVKRAEDDLLSKSRSERDVAIDFYYNKNLDKHIEPWFPGTSLSQIPPAPMQLVRRFARSRMLLWRKPPERFINGGPADDYELLTHHLNTTCREASELAWLLGNMHIRSWWNERHERLEYDIIEHAKEYILQGEREPFGLSYEIGKDLRGNRQFVFWSEERDGEPGLHFKFDTSGKINPVGDNVSLINPYKILPFSRIRFSADASDVTRMGIHASIGWTEIMLGVRGNLGTLAISGIDTEIPDLKTGPDRVWALPEGSTASYVNPGSNLKDMIESVKMLVNQTASNHSLAIRWGEGGTPPSGEALRILEIENVQSREADIPLFKEWEESRYEVDRTILQVHTGKSLGEDYYVDFGEHGQITTWADEKSRLEFMIQNNLISKKELIRYFNPDADEAEINEKLGELQEEIPTEPQQTTFEGLRRLGSVSA